MNLSDEDFENLTHKFNLVTSTIITVLGVFGNSCSIYIFLSKKFRKHSTNRWLALLAFSDLVQSCLSWPQGDTSLYEPTPFNCKCILYVVLHFFLLCSTLLSIASVDRMLAVIYPTRFLSREKLRVQLFILLAATVLIMAINSPYLIYYDAVEQDNITMCTYNFPDAAIYFDILICVFALVIPVIIMIACAITISIKLFASKKRVGKITSNKRDAHFTKTLFGMIIFFIIMNSPVNIGVIFTDYYISIGQDVNFNLFLYNVLNVISLFHNSCPFIVYFACNKLFRKKFYRMVGFKHAHSKTQLYVNNSYQIQHSNAIKD